jgi:hypothetical protein
MRNTYQNDPETDRAVDEFKRLLKQKSRQEREALLQQARDEALADELEEAREATEREAAALREELSRDDPREAAVRARDQAKSSALLLIMLLLILWLIAAATGRSDILRLPGTQQTQPLQPVLEGDGGITTSSVESSGNVDMQAGSIEPVPPIGQAFAGFYDANGKARIFGKPIGPEMVDPSSGLRYQWFERALLKELPQFNITGWGIQGDRLGATATRDIVFPTQVPFISNDSARYFQETSHSLRGRFLDFWNRNNGLLVLGYPISEEIQETLPNQQRYLVQYFERGRLELHPENAGTDDEVQIGLLGTEINRNPDWQRIISFDASEPLPTPTPAAPAAVTPR